MPGRHRLSLIAALCALVVLAGPPDASSASEFEDPAAAEPDATVYSPTFADVPDDHVFASSVRAVLAAGITRGCDENSTQFCPDRPVTRGQMAAFLSRGLALPAGDDSGFTDDDGHVFEDAISRLAAADITTGCNPPDNDNFCPDRPVTRGQMASFLTRALELPVPPAIPSGVQLERGHTESSGAGASVTVCREAEISLLVRSLVGGAKGLSGVTAWAPSTFELSSGEVDLDPDLWYLPPEQGCHDIDIAWDPHANVVEPPLASLEITSPFGYRRHPILGGTRLHTGTDFDADTGDPVFASSPGVVVFASTRGGYGQMVEIQHIGGLNTRYAHLSSIAVTVGAQVETGDVVGAVGCTGLCTGSHLHFETLEFGEAVDPMSHLVGG